MQAVFWTDTHTKEDEALFWIIIHILVSYITNHLIILQLNNYNFLGYILFMTLQQNVFKIVYLNVQSNYEGCYGLIFKYH